MSDDIVTRLRGYGEGVWCICGAPSHYDCSCDPFETITAKAADEIERLRRFLQLMSIDYQTQIAGIKMRCECGAANDDTK